MSPGEMHAADDEPRSERRLRRRLRSEYSPMGGHRGGEPERSPPPDLYIVGLTARTPKRYGDGRMTVVALGADHAGILLKEALKSSLARGGHRVLDFGTHSTDPVDYPDVAAAVGGALAARQAERGILVCGSGIGMAIAANKVAGVRAAQCGDVDSARLCRQHNDTNVLTLGARMTTPELAARIVEMWLGTGFDGGRHARRVDKLTALERREPMLDASTR